MEKTVKNLRRSIRQLKVGERLEIPKGEYMPVSIRSTATLVKENYDQRYSVSVKHPEKIVVTRKS